ncbi:hypothetical protein CPB85DRAFT_1257609 [Mucidula mucida]|nr:hypothetical protein CPB85DRAFT_1257609 [Mucidula mucida]
MRAITSSTTLRMRPKSTGKVGQSWAEWVMVGGEKARFPLWASTNWDGLDLAPGSFTANAISRRDRHVQAIAKNSHVCLWNSHGTIKNLQLYVLCSVDGVPGLRWGGTLQNMHVNQSHETNPSINSPHHSRPIDSTGSYLDVHDSDPRIPSQWNPSRTMRHCSEIRDVPPKVWQTVKTERGFRDASRECVCRKIDVMRENVGCLSPPHPLHPAGVIVMVLE